jgi:hypothetical protein
MGEGRGIFFNAIAVAVRMRPGLDHCVFKGDVLSFRRPEGLFKAFHAG